MSNEVAPESVELSGAAPHDLVYVVKDGDNEELRYSLRSVWEHLPSPRKVWIFGGGPNWLHNVERVTIPQASGKYENSRANLRAAVWSPEVAETFVLCNDDHFVMEPLPGIPVLNRGPVEPVIRQYEAINSGFYLWGMRNTVQVLHDLGVDDVLSYELHVPFPMTKTRARAVFDLIDAQPLIPSGRDLIAAPFHFRTLYGNLHRVGGHSIDDVKVSDRAVDVESPFLSTSDYSFNKGTIGRHVRARFPRRGGYENPPTFVGERTKGTIVTHIYTEATSGQRIESETPLEHLEGLARWEHTERSGPDPDAPLAEPVTPTPTALVDAGLANSTGPSTGGELDEDTQPLPDGAVGHSDGEAPAGENADPEPDGAPETSELGDGAAEAPELGGISDEEQAKVDAALAAEAEAHAAEAAARAAEAHADEPKIARPHRDEKKDVWLEYANTGLGLGLAADTKKADIITAIDAAEK